MVDQKHDFLQQMNNMSGDTNFDEFDETNIKQFAYELKDLSNFEVRNDIFFRALNNKEVERIPLVFLTKPEKNLTEYNELSENIGFLLNFKPDAISINPNPLILLEILGKKSNNSATGGYCLEFLKDPSDLKTLKKLELDNEILQCLLDAIYGARTNLKGEVSLIGTCQSAFSNLIYLVESNKKAKIFDKIKKWIYSYTKEAEFLLEFLNDTLFIFLCEQIKNGAQSIIIEDKNANILDKYDYEKFSLKYNVDLASRIRQKFNHIPIIFNIKGQNGNHSAVFSSTSFDCIGLDFNSNEEEIVRLANQNNKAIFGNLDISIMSGNKEHIRKKTEIMLNQFKKAKYLAGLSDELDRNMDYEKLNAFADTIRNFNNK